MTEASTPRRGDARASDMLESAADTFRERNEVYGDNYYAFGNVMAAVFPTGITLTSANDFNRFGILVQKVAKLTRYCANFSTGGHQDSIHDDVVYSAMLEEMDHVIACRNQEEIDEQPSF